MHHKPFPNFPRHFPCHVGSTGEEGGPSTVATRSWFSACEEAMHALFHSHPCPDKVLTSVVAPLFASLR